ncbi:MAG: AAA family ATPase [Candidatus Eisenbacteria bacterium]
MTRTSQSQQAILEREAPSEHPARTGMTHVVASGKGGVGKSTLSILLAREMAVRGRRVLLFDGSQNQGNLHILLGVAPARDLVGLLAGDSEPESLLRHVSEGLWLLPSASGSERLQGFSPLDRARLHLRLSELFDSYDDIVVDAGPGYEAAVRAATMRASRLIAVAVPEPASLADAYAVVKLVHLQAPTLAIDLLVNQVVDEEEGLAVLERLQFASERFLGRSLGYLGSVRERSDVRASARTPGALLGLRDDDVAGAAERILDADANAAGERDARAGDSWAI